MLQIARHPAAGRASGSPCTAYLGRRHQESTALETHQVLLGVALGRRYSHGWA